MPLSLDVTVVRARIPAVNRVLHLPSLPPQGDLAAWLDAGIKSLKRQDAPRLMGGVDIAIRLEDTHPRLAACACIAPVLTLLLKAGVLASDRAPSLRRVGIEWAPVAGVEIHIRRGT
jgi:hypothetical protein